MAGNFPDWLRVAEVVRKHEGPSPKSWKLDESFKHYHTLHCQENKNCHNLRTFWKSLGKYHTELNLQICNYAQERRICREDREYAPNENLNGQKAAIICHPASMSCVYLHSYRVKQ